MRETVPQRLVRMYRCRDEEGGCGALRGEQCKTFVHHRPTQPHVDRWNQWNLDGSPGAWWHQPGQDRGAPVKVRVIGKADGKIQFTAAWPDGLPQEGQVYEGEIELVIPHE